MIDFYSVSFKAVHAQHNELLQQAARDRLLKQHTIHHSLGQRVARSLGYVMVRWGLRLLRYGRVNQIVLVRNQEAQLGSVQSN
ncbi:MAG: hypothetical protein GFH27_549291n146 [Chloroflexi bacterium AL-W]|nr:hypothetical protein [Chloroflexi bacterium AL-N1]NOK67387.1 hypothetical protein [Chloroflexi bacterium AL-N10]NOK75121.1 hypothetical protein [Chloroflexi bacterium AL-N5]NOK81908.1 hypothetical protein [Chloroflexi bacterium AL-W]NOK89754.1 hypothetical protein [Chloroflexi bacterium AL-N15]